MATEYHSPARPQSAPPPRDVDAAVLLLASHDGSWSEPATSPSRAQRDQEDDAVAFAHASPRDSYRRERANSDAPSIASNMSSATTDTSDSGSSSGSDSTLTPSAFGRMDSPTIPMSHSRAAPFPHRPNPLEFLDDPNASAPTPESIQASFRTAATHRRALSTSSGSSPSNRSTASSSSSGFGHDPFADGFDRETDYHTSPERSPQSQMAYSPAAPRPRGGRQQQQQQQRQQQATYWGRDRHRSYGTPEMPRGTADLPHIPQSDLTPRAHTYGGHPKHLPRAEKLPLSGYEMLAAHLTCSSQAAPLLPPHAGPAVRPLYRRFEALNHRLLLHLQDELCELEEQLHRLDTADTQNRRLQNGILPASRRADFQTAGELQWHKTDVLGKIGFKLEQYNHVLSSFQSTQALPAPSPADIHDYRAYLATHGPIVDSETRFLDATGDLVCLDVFDDEADEDEGSQPAGEHDDDDEDNGVRTPLPPVPETTLVPHEQPPSPVPFTPPLGHRAIKAPNDDDEAVRRAVRTLGPAMATALLLPVLLFTVIPGYWGRVMAALLVALGGAAVLSAQDRDGGGGGGVGVVGARLSPADWCAGAGLYGVVMATVAGVCR